MDYPLLNTIDAPADLRLLGREQIAAVAAEIRAFLLE